MSAISRTFATLTAALVAVGFSATAGAETTLRMSSQWTENTIGSQVDKWWSQEIEKRTKGQVKIKIFFEGALGKAKENLTLIQQGASDTQSVGVSAMAALNRRVSRFSERALGDEGGPDNEGGC